MIAVAVGHLGAGLDAVEIAPGDEVHHPGHGVGAVDRRGALGQHLDPLQGQGREDIGIGQGVVHARQRQAVTVDQDQGGVRGAGPQAVDGRRIRAGAIGAAEGSLPDTAHADDRRDRPQDLLHRLGAGLLNLLLAHGDHAGPHRRRAAQAGPGDDHLGQFGDFGLGRGLSQGGGSGQGGQDRDGRTAHEARGPRRPAPREFGLVHRFPPKGIVSSLVRGRRGRSPTGRSLVFGEPFRFLGRIGSDPGRPGGHIRTGRLCLHPPSCRTRRY